MTAGALDGVRVVDDTCTIGGRTATMLLADHGAEVLRLGAPPGTLGPAELTLDRNKVLLAPPGRGAMAELRRLIAAQQLTTMVGGLDVERVFSPAKSLHAGPNFRMYRGSDGRWFYLAALSGSFFIRALESIDRLDVLLLPGVDGEFSNVLIPEIGRQVGAELEQVFASRPSAAWLGGLPAADLPGAPVGRRGEALV